MASSTASTRVKIWDIEPLISIKLRYCGADRKGEMAVPNFVDMATPLKINGNEVRITKIPLSNFNTNIDFYQTAYPYKTGTIGYKIWIYYIDTQNKSFRTRKENTFKLDF